MKIFNFQKTGEILFFALFAILTLLSLVPLYIVRFPPMQDAYQHLAIADIIHNYGAEGYIYKDYFDLPSSVKPNMLYYYLCSLVGFFTGIEPANKIIISLYVILLPLSFGYFLVSFGRNRILSLFVFPFIYNAFFGYGFVSFFLGIPLILFGLGAYRRYLEKTCATIKSRHAAIFSFLLLLSFFVHAHIFLLFSMLAGSLMLFNFFSRLNEIGRDRRRYLAYNFLLFVPSLLVFLPWFIEYFVFQTPSQAGIKFGGFDSFFGPTYYKFNYLITSFFHYIGNFFDDDSEEMIFLAVSFAALAMAAFAKRAAGLRKDLEFLTIVTAVSIFALPEHISAQAIVSTRHIFFLFLFFFGWIAFEERKRLVIPLAVALAVISIISFANTAKGFIRFDRELDELPELFESLKPHKRLLKVAYSSESSFINYGVFWHTHYLYLVLKGGISDVQFAEYPSNPVQYKRGTVPPKPPFEFYENNEWKYFDYILFRKDRMPFRKSLLNEMRFVAENREWAIFEVACMPEKQTEESLEIFGRREPGI
ncbi:MAG: hypothetical protein FJ088_08020 [Deltaproteobacteria bacterium]|nr:hypothetical protein [Deltaproteobacteria bacterium]